MKWRQWLVVLAVLVVLYYLGAVLLGSLGIDIQWRGFRSPPASPSQIR